MDAAGGCSCAERSSESKAVIWNQLPPTHITASLLSKVHAAGINYETEAHRNYRSIIIIVSPKQSLERLRGNLEKRIENTKIDFFSEIQYVAEEDL